MSQARKSFKTEKGTELPLLTLKGKEYLQVAHRLVWFRERHPTGIIKTSLVDKGGSGKDAYAIFRAEIFIDGPTGPVLVSSAHKNETMGGFPDCIEKSETGAIGRALALMGIGTQFTADELDEGSRLADAPLDAPVSVKSENSAPVSSGRTSFRKTVSVAEPVTTQVASGDDL